MTSRERVVRCLNHEATDRVTLDYHAEPEVDQRLMHDLCVPDYDALQERLHSDIRRIIPKPVTEPRWYLDDGTREDYWGIRSRTMHGAKGTYDEFVWNPMWDMQTLEEVKAHSWPSPDMYDYSVLPTEAAKYKEYGILWEGWEGADIFTRPSILRGMDNLMMDMALRPEIAHLIIGKFTDFYCEDLTRALEATDGEIMFASEWSDFGMQDRLLMSIPMWREFVKPYLKRLVDVAHTGGIKYMVHSCGAIRELIPDMIEIGVDILDPIQVMAKGMEPEGLKRDFGGKIAFHGSLCTQSTLPFGTPDDVAQSVRDRIRVFGTAGFILAPSHNIQPDTSTANIVAMYDTAASVVA